MSDTIRVGIAGAGLMGAVHARAYAQIPGVELAGVADPIQEKARALSSEVGCPPFHDYEALLQSGIDILSVCLPCTCRRLWRLLRLTRT
jgi:UDP-N-acetylglucosamine 3-dehydrogenase